MKSLTAVCQTGASMPAVNPNGRITRHHPPQRADGENAEMKMYLSKLKDLVPFMPKNRKLSKLEIIQHVIDYICDLQTELESHPEINNFDATIALNISNNNHRNANHGSNNNNIFNKVNIFNGLQQQQQQQQQQEHDNENDVIMPEETQERLQQNTDTQQQVQQQQQQQEQQQTSHIIQQQQSSPIQRQPLADRQTPNTILPPAKAIINASSSSSSSSSFSSRIDSIQSQRQLFLSSNSTTTINFNTTLTTTAQLSVTDTNSTTAITATATSATIACNSPATATAASLIHNDTLTLNKKSDYLDKMKTDNADDISPPC